MTVNPPDWAGSEPYIDVTLRQKCVGCDEPCLSVCPTDAVKKIDNGSRIVINMEDCTVSGGCVAACPYGVIKWYERK